MIDGSVRNAAEYAGQGEFAGQVRALLVTLPDVPGRAELLSQADELAGQVTRKLPGSGADRC